jgi:hypothetical protein
VNRFGGQVRRPPDSAICEIAFVPAHGFLFQRHAEYAADIEAFLSQES